MLFDRIAMDMVNACQSGCWPNEQVVCTLNPGMRWKSGVVCVMQGIADPTVRCRNVHRGKIPWAGLAMNPVEIVRDAVTVTIRQGCVNAFPGTMGRPVTRCRFCFKHYYNDNNCSIPSPCQMILHLSEFDLLYFFIFFIYSFFYRFHFLFTSTVEFYIIFYYFFYLW